MKWIRNRKSFLNEAKIKDVILPTQAKAVSEKWGAKYLDYEEIEPTKDIEQGRWKLNYEDKMLVFSTFMNCDMDEIIQLFGNLPQAFVNFVSEVASENIKGIDISRPTLDQLVFIFNPIFKKISVNDTLANTMISKDEKGRPIKDSDGSMIKIEKIPGELVLTNNLVNINTILSDYNSMVGKYLDSKLGEKYKESDLLKDDLFMDNNELQNYVSAAKDDSNSDYNWKYDVEIFEKDIYLSIKHNPKDILNMSISKFYSSCQHLYTGSMRKQLLSNIFDPNSIPAFLLFESPIFNKDNNKISDVMPLARMQIRKVERINNNNDKSLLFDRCYPDRLKDTFNEIIEKYTSNVYNRDDDSNFSYVYSPDIDINDVLSASYHDRLNSINNKKMLGRNAKTLHLTDLYNWSNFIITPENSLRELIIETVDIPDDLFKIKLSLEWIKFKYLDIDTLKPFSNFSFDGIAFEKCKFNNTLFDDILKNTPNIKKIKFISSDFDLVNLKEFKNLEELHFIYTLDTLDELKNIIEGINLKKLVVSGDLLTKENKTFFNSLKLKGIKIEVVGPYI